MNCRRLDAETEKESMIDEELGMTKTSTMIFIPVNPGGQRQVNPFT